MNFFGSLIVFISAIFTVADSRADDCQFTFKCENGICQRVTLNSCSLNRAAANVFIAAPSPVTDSTQLFVPREDLTVIQKNVSASNSAAVSLPSIGNACAENGSCFGDISNITGVPKTTHINGYYRRDGTYVRGHYRSKSR